MDKRNSEGYSDPTAYKALSNVEREEARAHKVKSLLSLMCDLAGYKIRGQVFLMDKRTGHTYRL